jgi:hypothetical protein
MTGQLGEVIRYDTSKLGLATAAKRLRALGGGVVYCLMPERSTWAHLRDYAFLRGVIGLHPRGIWPAIFGNMRQGPFRPAYSPTVEWRRLLACVGSRNYDLEFPLLKPSADAEQSAARLCKEVQGERFLVACPGSKMPAKRWPGENYRQVFQRFLSDHPEARVVLVGSPAERELCEYVAAVDRARIFNRAGDFSLDESVAVCSRAALYFGNDTGAMHVAAAMGKPCIAIFSARDYRGKWEPYGSGHVILRENVSCEGCMLEECTVQGLRCLTAIDTVAAFRQLGRAWRSPHGQPAAQHTPAADKVHP